MKNYDSDINLGQSQYGSSICTSPCRVSTARQYLPVHAESVNMMEGLDEAEEDQYFNDNPKIIPVFEVDVLNTLTIYI